jgi:hypothetical protein
MVDTNQEFIEGVLPDMVADLTTGKRRNYGCNRYDLLGKVTRKTNRESGSYPLTSRKPTHFPIGCEADWHNC